MTINEIKDFAKENEALTDQQLAREFVERDKLVLKFWNDTPDILSDEHQILQDVIIERFVRNAKIGLVWNDDVQNWVVPGWHKTSQDKGYKKIEYWI